MIPQYVQGLDSYIAELKGRTSFPSQNTALVGLREMVPHKDSENENLSVKANVGLVIVQLY